MEMDNKSYIRSLLVRHKVKMPELAEKMTTELGKLYTVDSINGKLNRDTISLKECQAIAKILGYHIEFIKNKD